MFAISGTRLQMLRYIVLDQLWATRRFLLAYGPIARCLRLKLPSMHTITRCRAPDHDYTQEIMLDCPNVQSLHLVDVCRYARVRAARAAMVTHSRALIFGVRNNLSHRATERASCPADLYRSAGCNKIQERSKMAGCKTCCDVMALTGEQ